MLTTPLDDDAIEGYYVPFHGHRAKDLALALNALRRRHDRVVFLAGDSSLDNKYWHDSWADAINGYERVLRPQRMKRDVCYWMNAEAAADDARGAGRRNASSSNTSSSSPSSIGCVNAAVEATALNDRAFGRLLPQDAFVRDNITENDVLIVSVGGNDVALQPLLCTCLNLSALVCCVPAACVEKCARASPPNLYRCRGRDVDCGCVGCGCQGCVAGLAGWPPGFGYVADLFKNRVENYVRKLCAATRPKVRSIHWSPYDRVGVVNADT